MAAARTAVPQTSVRSMAAARTAVPQTSARSMAAARTAAAASASPATAAVAAASTAASAGSINTGTAASAAPTPTPHFQPASIRPGTFVYLVMGETAVPDLYVRTSLIPDVHVIFLAWKAPPPTANIGKVQTDFFPKSSWASGRNHLSDLALAKEKEQGWNFEFWLFCDGDARLIKRLNQAHYPAASSHMEASEHLRLLLLRDRPARAGVAYPLHPDRIPTIPMDCVQNCAYDAAVDIFHRTALRPVLPYPTKFDSISWWMASE
eukprot:scpid86754/ scgid7670/ 